MESRAPDGPRHAERIRRSCELITLVQRWSGPVQDKPSQTHGLLLSLRRAGFQPAERAQIEGVGLGAYGGRNHPQGRNPHFIMVLTSMTTPEKMSRITNRRPAT